MTIPVDPQKRFQPQNSWAEIFTAWDEKFRPVEEKQLRECFGKFDANGDGKIQAESEAGDLGQFCCTKSFFGNFFLGGDLGYEKDIQDD